MPFPALDAQRDKAREAVHVSIREARPGAIQVVHATPGLGKTTAVYSADGRRICLALPSRKHRDEKAREWAAASVAAARPFLVKSVAELCTPGFNGLLQRGHGLNRDSRSGLHQAVCPSGHSCRYGSHLADLFAAADEGTPLVVTHAWLTSELAIELLVQHEYVVVVDEVHNLIEQEDVTDAELQQYLVGADTEWRAWAQPAADLAIALSGRLAEVAEAERGRVLEQRRKKLDSGESWAPPPYPERRGGIGWVQPSPVLERAADQAATIDSPAPVKGRNGERWAWMPLFARHLALLLRGGLPEEVGANVTLRLEVRQAETGLACRAWLRWTRWSRLLSTALPLVFLDATFDHSREALEGAYPGTAIESRRVVASLPGPEEGLHSLHLQTASLTARNLRGPHGRLSIRGRAALRNVLRVAVEFAGKNSQTKVDLGFIGRKYVADDVRRSTENEPDRGPLVETFSRLRELGQLGTVVVGHYGAVRGSNAFQGAELLVLFGDPIPNLPDTQDQCEVLGVDLDDHLANLRLAEVVQALHRARPVRLPEFGRSQFLVTAGRHTPPQLRGLKVRKLRQGRPRSVVREAADLLGRDLLRSSGVLSRRIALLTAQALVELVSNASGTSAVPSQVLAILERVELGEVPAPLVSGRVLGAIGEAAGASKSTLSGGRPGRPESLWVLSHTSQQHWEAELRAGQSRELAKAAAETLLTVWRGDSD